MNIASIEIFFFLAFAPTVNATINWCHKRRELFERALTFNFPGGCNGGGGGGDPHIKKWNDERYYFMGECDLYLLKNDIFNHGQGLDVQIRTTVRDFYSFIETTAIRLGDDVIEMSIGNTGTFKVNGVDHGDNDLPMNISGYKFDVVNSFKGDKAGTYILDLNNGDFIGLRTFKLHMSVEINGDEQDFKSSSGMMGTYPEGLMLARDGVTIYEVDGQMVKKDGDLENQGNAMGAEWQVRPGIDPVLFSSTRAPQWPAQCIMPAASGRHLRKRNDPSQTRKAERACAGKSQQDFEFCVMDVLVFEDEDMAFAW